METPNDDLITAFKTGRLNAANISARALRELGKRDSGLWGSIRPGWGILNSAEELDQYLYSYGSMTLGQWRALPNDIRLPDQPTRIVDYGCGKGLVVRVLLTSSALL